MKNEENMNTLHDNAGAAKVPDEMLEKVSGGFVAPDTAENRKRWEDLLEAIRDKLMSINESHSRLPDELSRAISEAMYLVFQCTEALEGDGDLYGAAMNLYSALENPHIGSNDMDCLRYRLRALLNG